MSIIDNGIGIREKDQGKLFKMFGSIKDEKNKVNTNGIGLGLVISKLIVSKFNGKMSFVSTFGKGSTFSYSLELEEFDMQVVK